MPKNPFEYKTYEALFAQRGKGETWQAETRKLFATLARSYRVGSRNTVARDALVYFHDLDYGIHKRVTWAWPNVPILRCSRKAKTSSIPPDKRPLAESEVLYLLSLVVGPVDGGSHQDSMQQLLDKMSKHKFPKKTALAFREDVMEQYFKEKTTSPAAHKELLESFNLKPLGYPSSDYELSYETIHRNEFDKNKTKPKSVSSNPGSVASSNDTTVTIDDDSVPSSQKSVASISQSFSPLQPLDSQRSEDSFEEKEKSHADTPGGDEVVHSGSGDSTVPATERDVLQQKLAQLDGDIKEIKLRVEMKKAELKFVMHAPDKKTGREALAKLYEEQNRLRNTRLETTNELRSMDTVSPTRSSELWEGVSSGEPGQKSSPFPPSSQYDPSKSSPRTKRMTPVRSSPQSTESPQSTQVVAGTPAASLSDVSSAGPASPVSQSPDSFFGDSTGNRLSSIGSRQRGSLGSIPEYVNLRRESPGASFSPGPSVSEQEKMFSWGLGAKRLSYDSPQSVNTTATEVAARYKNNPSQSSGMSNPATPYSYSVSPAASQPSVAGSGEASAKASSSGTLLTPRFSSSFENSDNDPAVPNDRRSSDRDGGRGSMTKEEFETVKLAREILDRDALLPRSFTGSYPSIFDDSRNVGDSMNVSGPSQASSASDAAGAGGGGVDEDRFSTGSRSVYGGPEFSGLMPRRTAPGPPDGGAEPPDGGGGGGGDDPAFDVGGDRFAPHFGTHNSTADTLRSQYGMQSASKVILPVEEQYKSDIMFDMFDWVKPGHGQGAHNKLYRMNEARDANIVGMSSGFSPGSYIGPEGGITVPSWKLQRVMPQNTLAAHHMREQAVRANKLQTYLQAGASSTGVLGCDVGYPFAYSEHGLPRPRSSPFEPVYRNDLNWEQVKLPTGEQLNRKRMRSEFDAQRYPLHLDGRASYYGGPHFKKRRALDVILP